MSGKKVISIRFHTDCREDMELYARMKQEAGKTSSLAAVVKVRIQDSYRKKDLAEEIHDLKENVLSELKEEIGKHIKTVFTECSSNNLNMIEASINNKNDLPEKCEELPSGALDFLQ